MRRENIETLCDLALSFFGPGLSRLGFCGTGAGVSSHLHNSYFRVLSNRRGARSCALTVAEWVLRR